MLRLALLILFSAVIPLSTGEFLQCSPSLHTCKAHYTKGYECRVDAKNEGRECVCKNVNSVQTINLIVQCIDCQKHEAWHPLHRECISRKCPAQLHRCYFDIDNIPKCVLSYTMGKCQCSLHQTVKYTAGNILQCADDCRLNMKNNEKTQQCTAKICPEDHECTATRGAFYKCHLRNNPSEICSCPHDELVTFSESKQAYVCQICSKEEEWNKETRQCQKRICIAGQHNCPTDSQCFTNDRKQCACAYGYKIEEACNRDGTYICTKTECVDGQYTCSDFNRCSNNNTDPCMCKDDHVTLPDSKHKFLCRASCTSGKEWDPHSGLCINSCYPRYWDGNQCVACDAEHSAWNWYAQACNLCDSDDMEFDGTTCIKRICKNGNHECASTERWGLSCKLRKNHDLLCYCPSNMSPKYSSSAELVCNQKCGEDERWFQQLNACRKVCSNPDKKYYDLVQQRCVACEVGEVLTTSIQKCESLCKGGLARYLDECRQPRVPCPVDNHVCAEQETEKISCHFNDDSMKKCKCPPNMSPKISSSAIMVCKQNCKTDEHWYPQLDACRKLCPDPDKEYFDIDQNKCVSCPAGKVLDRATQQCILLCPVDNHECAKQAGELSCHLIDDRNTKCKCSLDMSPKLSSSAKTVCNKKCWEDEKWFQLLNACRKRCQDPDKEYYDLVQQRCVACPAGKILNRALQKCELRCEVSKYFGPCKSPTG